MLFFASGSATVSPHARRAIGQAAAIAKSLGSESTITVEANTDLAGSSEANLILSLRRGEAIRQALTAEGVDASRIRILPRGDQFPIVQTARGVSEPQNRRAVLYVHGGSDWAQSMYRGWRTERYQCIETKERLVPAQ